MNDQINAHLFLPGSATPDTLQEIYPEAVLTALRREPAQEVQARLTALTASGPLPFETADAYDVIRGRVVRAAWETYTTAARATGILDEDVVARLKSPRHEQFLSAMAECEAAWILSAKLGFDVGPRTPESAGARRPEFPVRKSGQVITVEVKAPWDRPPEAEMYMYDPAAPMARVIAEAYKQFSKDGPNLLVVVPTLFRPVIRDTLIASFLGSDRITVVVGPDGKGRDLGVKFFPDGPLLKRWGDAGARYKRIGAILVIDEVIGDYRTPGGRADLHAFHRLFVIHNPNSTHPIPPVFFGGHPQFVPNDGRMVWSKPWDSTDYARELARQERRIDRMDRISWPDPEERKRMSAGLDLVARALVGPSQ
jgi:hypothetical protein